MKLFWLVSVNFLLYNMTLQKYPLSVLYLILKVWPTLAICLKRTDTRKGRYPKGPIPARADTYHYNSTNLPQGRESYAKISNLCKITLTHTTSIKICPIQQLYDITPFLSR